MAPPAEISIPSTILSNTESKPFTLYNITLRLPLRSFVVQKRYSDFATLHTALASQVGAPPPAPLPSKSWFSSTVSSAELTEERRRGLETYLRAIAESPDRRWRDTSLWRSFLSLPSSSSTANSSVSAHGMVSTAAVGAADPTTWLDLHREMKAALHGAHSWLGKRDGAHEKNDAKAAAEAGAQAKRELVKVGTLCSSLSDGLRAIQDSHRLGDGEIRRRRDMLASARVEKEGLEKLSNQVSAAAGAPGGRNNGRDASWGTERSTLLGGSPSGSSSTTATSWRTSGRVFGAPLPETDRTRELDNGQVLQVQKQVMNGQDQEIGMLAAAVRRQREMGIAIKDEVDRQNEMLDHLNEDVDRVGSKLWVARNRMKKL